MSPSDDKQADILLTVPRQNYFVDLLCFFCRVFALTLCASVYIYVPYGQLLGKG